MLKSIEIDFKGLVMVTGPTKSGKSQLAELFLADHKSVSYIATSVNKQNDS